MSDESLNDEGAPESVAKDTIAELETPSETTDPPAEDGSTTTPARQIPPLPLRKAPFVPPGIAPISSKPPALPTDASRKLRKGNKMTLPSFLRIPTDPPVFTTPLLDFAAHAEELTRLAAALYRLRDHYFELYPAKPFPKENRLTYAQRCQAEKVQRMRIAYKAVMDRFTTLTMPYHLAVFHFLRGHINNYFQKHSPDAERDLRVATFLSPNDHESHISLAECVLKRGDLEGALAVAETALKIVVPRRKEVLRMVAMVLRHVSSKKAGGVPGSEANTKVFRDQILRALELGKEAVSLDLDDGVSWFGLGMTHLNLFFNATQDKQDLLKALKAFDKASACKVNAGASLPDLYYNRALVHQCLDEVEKAIQDFETANQLDPTAGWSGEAEGLRRMVLRIIENINKKGHIRLTRISDILHALRNPSPNSVAAKRFKDVEYKSFAEIMRSKPKKAKPAADAQTDSAKACLRFAVIADIEHTRVVPRSLLGMDRDGVVFCVAIYNIRPDAFKVGDEVFVLDPNCKDIDVPSMSMKYPLVRIDNPAGVSVNARPLNSNDVLLTTCTCFLPGSEDGAAEGAASEVKK
ncbi:hypothetical protein DFJ74DRAFT_711956 [Hyaloraphidium curvatum]|nr:hypothetical protein DFJ74DRAFT_711956 [Hyaloraphidium curvatum]